jgi:hypothetical protein
VVQGFAASARRAFVFLLRMSYLGSRQIGRLALRSDGDATAPLIT